MKKRVNLFGVCSFFKSFLLGILADQTNLTKNIDNRSVMQEKGIFDYVQSIKPEEILKRRLISGFMAKRSKGKMKYFQRRWFILISAKSLVHEFNHKF